MFISSLRRHFFTQFNRKCSTQPPRCDAHMNELPIPCMPWDPWYKKQQRTYNIILVCGLSWWLFSFGMLIYTESIFLNFSPPLQPGPPSDVIEEGDDPEDTTA